MDGNSKKLVKAIGVFLGLALLLTFFSRTIYDYRLPTVTVELPAGGNLVDILEESALIQYAQSTNIYAERDGKIKDVFVCTGQEVKKGQPILELEADIEKAEQLALDVEEKERDIELLTVKLTNTQSGLKKSEYASGILRAERMLEEKRALYDAGAASRSEVDEAEYVLEAAQRQYEQYLQAQNESTSELSLQISNARSELAILNKKLAQAENGVITAEGDGVVADVKAEKGAFAAQNDILFQLAELSGGWKAELIIDEEKTALFDEQSVAQLKVRGIPEILTGEITAISPYESENGAGQKITVSIKDIGKSLAGKRADIKIKTQRGPYASVIPNCALRKDENGYYILVLREENHTLGKNYIAHKVSVSLLDADASLSAVEGPALAEPIITASTSPIEHGSRVKYIEAGDLE